MLQLSVYDICILFTGKTKKSRSKLKTYLKYGLRVSVEICEVNEIKKSKHHSKKMKFVKNYLSN